MRTAPALTRTICGVLLTMVLALRLLAPAGFMPTFDHGAVTIVACPDSDPAPVATMAAHHHHGNGQHALHQPCPYASASSLGGLATDLAPIIGVLILTAVLLLGRRNFQFVKPRRDYERPPSRAPPLPA